MNFFGVESANRNQGIALGLQIPHGEESFEVRQRRGSSQDETVILLTLGDGWSVPNASESKHLDIRQTMKNRIVRHFGGGQVVHRRYRHCEQAEREEATIGKMLRQVSQGHLCVVALLILSNCGEPGAEDRYQHFTIRGDPSTHTHVLYETPRVKSMVDEALQAEREYWSGLHSPNESERMATLFEGRPGKIYSKLLGTMGDEPGFEVPGQTHCRLLFEMANLPYSKVQFDDGPFRGQIGWLSRALFDDPRTGMP